MAFTGPMPMRGCLSTPGLGHSDHGAPVYQWGGSPLSNQHHDSVAVDHVSVHPAVASRTGSRVKLAKTRHAMFF